MITTHPPTLIVVDDEEAVRYSFRRMMNKEPFHLETYSNGREALERVRRGDVSVVVLDVRLGGDMEGTELLRHIKEFDPKISAILMTAYASANTDNSTKIFNMRWFSQWSENIFNFISHF